MPIVATDLILYASANTPEDDSATTGGAIDELRRLDFTQIAADDDIEAISDNAGDTQSVELDARNLAGAIVTEVETMTGTTAVIFSTIGIIERVLKFELASVAVGTITVRRSVAGATVRIVPVGERGFEIFFYDSASESSSTIRYQKAFYLNDHATLTLNNAQIQITADPEAIMDFALGTAKDDSETTTNRKTAPSAVSSFDDNQKSVPGTTLEAASRIAVWIRMQLIADDTPKRNTITLELTGTSV